jgi:hypothetical protein
MLAKREHPESTTQGTGTLCGNVKTSEIKDLKLILYKRYEFLFEMQIQNFRAKRA